MRPVTSCVAMRLMDTCASDRCFMWKSVCWIIPCALLGCEAMVLVVGLASGQPPPGKVAAPFLKDPAPPPKMKEAPPPLDVEREILKEIKEAYKAPREV